MSALRRIRTLSEKGHHRWIPSVDSSGGLTTLRDLIRIYEGPSFLMEAHNVRCAAIAERAGFKGLWASSLSVSSSLDYRDANEASWSEVADMVERMAHAAGIPILVDGDSGFGCSKNARFVARSLRQRGASGICIEEKAFGKMSSSVGGRHRLADIEEFCGGLKAMKDSVADPEFVLVAQIKGLIPGHDQDEALARAHAYAEAGADAVLIHSRESDPAETLTFARSWRNRLPVIIVPPKYYRTPVSVYRAAGISTVIWANHNMRAAFAAMRQVCEPIILGDTPVSLQPEDATPEEPFELLGYLEMEAAMEALAATAASGTLNNRKPRIHHRTNRRVSYD